MTLKKHQIGSVVRSSIVRRTSFNLDEEQKVSKPVYSSLAPYDDPILEKPPNDSDKNINEIDFQMLSATVLKVLNFINKNIGISGVTPPMYLSEISLKIEHPSSTIKKIIQNLENMGLIKREKYKPGRGGWTSYSLSPTIRDYLKTINNIKKHN